MNLLHLGERADIKGILRKGDSSNKSYSTAAHGVIDKFMNDVYSHLPENASPFNQFVSDIYDRRLEAKKTGDEAMSFVYKILMNSLYGRFGINPESTVTEICEQNRYNELMKKDNFQSAEKLNDKYYLVNFISTEHSLLVRAS